MAIFTPRRTNSHCNEAMSCLLATYFSGAGTNLKGGGTHQVQSAVKSSSCTFFAVWSVYCFCSCTRGVPHAQPFAKMGGRAPVSYGVGTTEHNGFCFTHKVCDHIDASVQCLYLN